MANKYRCYMYIALDPYVPWCISLRVAVDSKSRILLQPVNKKIKFLILLVRYEHGI